MFRFFVPAAVLAATVSFASAADVSADVKQLSRDIFKELIEINTTDSVGNTTDAAKAMAARLRAAGFDDKDIFVGGPNPRKGNLVVRLHGTGARRPILFMGHLDVVEARRSDWTSDPFQFIEKDGYFYGRGTQDMKSGDAILMTTFLRLKKEGYRPDRDLILMLTADEEGGKSNGADWLVKNQRPLVDAEFAINHDGGGVYTVKGKPLLVSLDAAEKTYADFELSVTNAGGHSSLPTTDNAIYHLVNALQRLETYVFPFELNAVTRPYFERVAKVESAEKADEMRAILKNPPDPAAMQRLAQDPLQNATMHTTCVATRLDAGHANNALPQSAKANVNCRILPGHAPEEIRQELIHVFADNKVLVRYVNNAGEISDAAPGAAPKIPESPRPEVIKPLERIADSFWPGAPVVPTMETGASDAVYTSPAGIPTYGVSGIAIDIDDVRAHGRDERVRVNSFYDGVEFGYRYIKALSAVGN